MSVNRKVTVPVGMTVVGSLNRSASSCYLGGTLLYPNGDRRALPHADRTVVDQKL